MMNFRSLQRSCASSTRFLTKNTVFCTHFHTSQRLQPHASYQQPNLDHSLFHLTNTNYSLNSINSSLPTINSHSFSSQSQTSPSDDNEGETEYLLSKGKVPEFNDPTKLSRSLISDIGINLEIDWTDWKQISAEYNKVLPYYINDFITYIAARTSDPVIRNEILRRIQYMLYKTGIGGKNNRGILAITSLFHMKKFIIDKMKSDGINNNEIINTNNNNGEMNEKEYNFYCKYGLTVDDLHNAFTVACAIESLQSYFLVLDDIMDNSVTRRGQLCWYRQPNVGLKAVNDAPIIESFVFWLINQRILDFTKNYAILPKFDHLNGKTGRSDNEIKPTHVALLEKLFQETKLQTLLGEAIDLELLADATKLKEQYTLDRYESIVLFKTSFYTFYLPYASVLYLSGYNDIPTIEGINNEEQCKLFHIARQLSMEMGMKFQIDDDFLDCFGDPNITGKVGTDIQDFKCSWLIVMAMRECTDEQFNDIICKHYGKDNEESVNKIKELYKELKLIELFESNEEKYTNKINKLIEQSESRLPKQMFLDIMKKLSKRKK